MVLEMKFWVRIRFGFVKEDGLELKLNYISRYVFYVKF